MSDFSPVYRILAILQSGSVCLSFCDVTDVAYDMCTHAAFHKAL